MNFRMVKLSWSILIKDYLTMGCSVFHIVKLYLQRDRDLRRVHEMLMPRTYWTEMTCDDKMWGYCIHHTREPLKGTPCHERQILSISVHFWVFRQNENIPSATTNDKLFGSTLPSKSSFRSSKGELLEDQFEWKYIQYMILAECLWSSRRNKTSDTTSTTERTRGCFLIKILFQMTFSRWYDQHSRFVLIKDWQKIFVYQLFSIMTISGHELNYN